MTIYNKVSIDSNFYIRVTQNFIAQLIKDARLDLIAYVLNVSDSRIISEEIKHVWLRNAITQTYREVEPNDEMQLSQVDPSELQRLNEDVV